MLRSPLLPTLVLTCLALILAATASAQIGATPQQCQTHYGHPVSASPSTCLYTKVDLSLAVTFYEGRAQEIMFHKIVSDGRGLPTALTRQEITQLLRVNSDGRTWKGLPADAGSEIWMTADGALMAIYNSASCTLMIMDKGSVDRRSLAEHLLKAPF